MSAPRNADAGRLDASDPLRDCRSHFVLPEGLIYLDGNSLGPASKAALAALQTTAHKEWADGLIRSWTAAGWWDLPLVVGDRIGRLVGAAPGQIVVTDTTSANLYKCLHAGLALRPGRRVILVERSAFPTDIYIAEGIAKSVPGVIIRLVEDRADGLASALGDDVAVVLANQVDYRTGALRPVADTTAAAHRAGAVIVWDLSHSAGAMPVGLDHANADFAVGCGYKYLNGGPGAPAFVYAASRHHDALAQPLTGWFGHAAPFDFEPSFRPVSGIRRMMCGTQPILAISALNAAVGLWDDVSIEAVREKSMALTNYFINLVEANCRGHGLSLASPRAAAERGSQVSFAHDNGYAIMQNLIARGVIGDFRAPNLMRFGFAPLYVRFADVQQAVAILKDILDSGSWREPRFAVRAAVT